MLGVRAALSGLSRRRCFTWLKRVLVVDDAIFMRNMIKDIFASGGFEVVGEAANGLEAVEKYKELKPDLTTMDIVMPFKSGIEATREIIKARRQRRGDHVLARSGRRSLVMEAIEAGASDFIVKPFRAEDVLAVVKKVLGERLSSSPAPCRRRLREVRMAMDMSRYLGLFVTEASEHLEALGRDLVQLEKEGGAGAVDSHVPPRPLGQGHGRLHGLRAHRHASPTGWRTCVDAVRQDPTRLNRELVDLLLAATDTLLAQVRPVAENKPPDDAGALLTQLAARVSALTGQALAPHPGDEGHRAADDARPAVLWIAGSGSGLGSAAASEREHPVRCGLAAPAPPRRPEAPGARSGWTRPQAALDREGARRAERARSRACARSWCTSGSPGWATVFDLRPALEDLKAGRIPDGLIRCEVETSAGEQGDPGRAEEHRPRWSWSRSSPSSPRRPRRRPWRRRLGSRATEAARAAGEAAPARCA